MNVLYAAAEISPFAKMTNTADLLRFLPASLQDKGFQIRILLPKYGSINDRRNRLHEVIRLSNIDVPDGDVTENMKIKVASIPNAKLQVYFLDNDTHFGRKGMFIDPKTEKAYPDNGRRTAFYNRGIMETVIKLNWKPDLIHCHDWASGFVPVFLKTLYRDHPMFKDAKVVYNIHSPVNEGIFGEEIFEYLDLPDDFDKSSVMSDGKVDFLRAGLKYADYVVTGNELGSQLDPIFDELGIKPHKIQGAPQDVSQKFADYYRELVP
jgi:starch synthase